MRVVRAPGSRGAARTCAESLEVDHCGAARGSGHPLVVAGHVRIVDGSRSPTRARVVLELRAGEQPVDGQVPPQRQQQREERQQALFTVGEPSLMGGFSPILSPSVRGRPTTSRSEFGLAPIRPGLGWCRG